MNEQNTRENMQSVLTELLRLYDWRRQVGATITDDQARQYGREKKAAWEAARRVLAVSEKGLTDEATKLADQWKGRADDAGRLSRAVLAQPDILAQVERALRKNPLIAMFLDQGFWHAHHVDIVIRHDGQDRRYEADWIVDLWYIVRRRGLSVSDAVKADQVGEGVSGGQSDPR